MNHWNDTAWFLAIAHWIQRVDWLQQPTLLFTRYGIVLPYVVAVVLLWRWRHHERLAAAIWIPIAMLAAAGIGRIVKAWIAERRPCQTLPDVPTLIPCDAVTDYSLPSNHSAVAAAFAVALCLARPAWGLPAGVFALLIGASRVLVGVHYPHDVVAGLVLGGAVGLLGLAVQPLILRIIPARWRQVAET